MKQRGFTLIEIIISIVVLSFVSAIILNLFIKSSNVNAQVEAESFASLYCSNLIEAHKNDAVSEPKTHEQYYSATWQEVSEPAQAEYRVVLKMSLAPQNKYLVEVNATAYNAQDRLLVSYKTHIIKRDAAVLSW